MVGAGINVIPFMIQRNVPGIGPFVLEAFAFAALPAVLAAIAYASSPSHAAPAAATSTSAGVSALIWLRRVVLAMVRAVGCDWRRLVRVRALRRDIARRSGGHVAASPKGMGAPDCRSPAVGGAGVNLLGVALYERLMVPLMFLTFVLAGVVIVAGFSFGHADFAAAVPARGAGDLAVEASPDLDVSLRLGGAFASFIGFDSIAQAGGERRTRPQPAARDRPGRRVGRRALHAFTAAVYHASRGAYRGRRSGGPTAPGCWDLLPPFWTVIIIAAAAVALAGICRRCCWCRG